ncbi:MAG: PDZ domain-containing protein, partial [Methylotetracoccus sp.]|nr:PDZ domain-containing protein [Methylotetracoccus sp.]
EPRTKSQEINEKIFPTFATSNHVRMDNPRRIYLYLPIILSLILILGIWLGSRLSVRNDNTSNKVTFIRPSSQDKLNELINYIEQDYVDSVSRTDLTEHAIEGILDNLDPHSTYIPAEDFMEVEDQLHSNFEGIGIQFRVEKDTIMVIQVISGGPSEKAGLLAGDRIVAINDSVVAGTGITSNGAVKLLKGKRGTEVNVSILRRGLASLIDFKIIRDVIPTYSIDISYMVNDSVGYIKLSRFAANTYEEMVGAMNRLLSQGMTDLIIDLRDNTGGYLQEHAHFSVAAGALHDVFARDAVRTTGTQAALLCAGQGAAGAGRAGVNPSYSTGYRPRGLHPG